MLPKSPFCIVITPPISSLPPLGKRQYSIIPAHKEKQFDVCYLASLELLSIKLLSARDIKEYLLFHTGVYFLSTAMTLFQCF